MIFINPARSKHFARAQGQRAKTNRLCAAMLAAYSQAQSHGPALPTEQQLNELVRRRAQLSELLTAQKQQLKLLTLPALRQANQLISSLENSLKDI